MTPKEGLIDVYWLYDDGGLTLLLPHILTTRAKFSKCKLRVFFLSSGDNSERANDYAKNMEALLSKFRIEFRVSSVSIFRGRRENTLLHSNLVIFQDVILLTDATKRPSRETKDEFKQMISLPTKCHLFRQAVTLSSSELGGNYSKFADDMIGFYIPYRVTHTISYVLLRIRFLGLNL